MKSFAASRYMKGVNVAVKKPRKNKNVGGVGSKSSSSKSSSSKSSSSKSSSSKSSSSKSSDPSQISKEESILFSIGNNFSLIDNYKKLFRKEAIINKFTVIDLLRLTKKQSILIGKKIDKIFVKINQSSLIYVDDTSYDVFRAKHDKLFAQLEKITDGFIEQYKDTTHKKKVVIYNIGLRNIFIILFEILKLFFEYMKTYVKIYGGISNEDMIYVNGYIMEEVEICYNELLEYDIYDIKEFIKQEREETFEKFYASVLIARQRKNERRFYSIAKNNTSDKK